MARFMRKGITKVRFVPTIVAIAAATTAEITAGTDLTAQTAELNGFEFSNSPIDVPDMSSAFVSKVAGEDTVADSSIVFYEDLTTNPIRTALAKGTNGYIVIYYGGQVGAGAVPAATSKYEAWPIQVASNARRYTAGNEAAQYNVMFANTAAPTEGVQAA